MRLKLFSISVLALLIAAAVTGQTSFNGKLNDATVFTSGAELVHTSNVKLKQGENELTITGLSSTVDRNSIKIKAPAGVVISSYEFSLDYRKPDATGRAGMIQDSLDILQKKLSDVQTELDINNQTANLLKAGITKNVEGSESGLGVDELMKTLEYYRDKSLQIEAKGKELNESIKNINLDLRRLRLELQQEQLKGSVTPGMIRVNASSARAIDAIFTITYYTSAANWAPFYDINIPGDGGKITFNSKARISQTTGFDWKGVNLTLSNSVPSDGKQAPLFETWFLREYSNPVMVRGIQAKSAQNVYSYAEEAIDEIIVTGYSARDSKKTTLPEPLYIVDGEIVSANEFKSIPPGMIKSMSVLKDKSATAVYGSRGSNGVIVVTLNSSMSDFIVESSNPIVTSFEISLPYTIPGNGKIQNIDLQTKEADAVFKYYSTPKLDSETYIIAEIPNAESLGLMAGKANITYDGTFLGETFVDPNSTLGKMTLTLGTDKRIAVKREKLTDYSSTKTLGSDIQQVFTYKITVKNNHNISVNMIVKDQYPISTAKNIEVRLLKETTPWTANNEEVGVLSWEETLQPGETKTYTVSYSVKYPKGMNLNLQ